MRLHGPWIAVSLAGCVPAADEFRDACTDAHADAGSREQHAGREPNPWRREPGCVPPRVARPNRPPLSNVAHAWGFDGAAAEGVCVLDYDGDGDMDLFVTADPTRLYRNDSSHFVEVTQEAGAAVTAGHGCVAFDYDGDGRPDLAVSLAFPCRDHCAVRLLHNRGGRFEDVSDAAGLVTGGWAESLAAGDVDGDGDLDLFVATLLAGQPVRPQPDQLWINQGDRFTEEAVERGVGRAEPDYVALFADVDGDGDIDLRIGNDAGRMLPDRMYINDGTGHFVDRARAMYQDFDDTGDSADTMGMDMGDWDLDGSQDFVATNYKGRPTQLYDCDARSICRNIAADIGLASSANYVNWGIGLADLDQDMDLDLYEASGCAFDFDPCGGADRENLEDQLFWNDGGAFVRYVPLTPDEALASEHESRGVAFSDLDGDGDLEVIVGNYDGLQVLRNDASAGHWIGIELVGTTSNRDGIGARVTVAVRDGCAITEQRISGASYLSSDDPRLHFGLGPATAADVTITWPSGIEQHRAALEAGRFWTITESDP